MVKALRKVIKRMPYYPLEVMLPPGDQAHRPSNAAIRVLQLRTKRFRSRCECCGLTRVLGATLRPLGVSLHERTVACRVDRAVSRGVTTAQTLLTGGRR